MSLAVRARDAGWAAGALAALAPTSSSLRFAASRNPSDRDLIDLVGDLSSRTEFRQRWARFQHQRRQARPHR